MTVLVPWLWSRLMSRAASPGRPERLRWLKFMQRAEALFSSLSLLATLRFLGGGRHPTLRMALLGISFEYTRPNVPRRASFDLMNQMLALRAASDVLHELKQAIHAFPSAAATSATASPGIVRLMLQRILTVLQLRPAALPRCPPAEGECTICGATPMHTPRAARCGHLSCYYCLASACMAGVGARCPVCNERLDPDPVQCIAHESRGTTT